MAENLTYRYRIGREDRATFKKTVIKEMNNAGIQDQPEDLYEAAVREIEWRYDNGYGPYTEFGKALYPIVKKARREAARVEEEKEHGGRRRKSRKSKKSRKTKRRNK